MKDRQDRKIKGATGANGLSAEEHLWLNWELERRSREIWLSGGCREGSALANWLQAERETWQRFVRSHAQRLFTGSGRQTKHTDEHAS